MPIAFPFYCFVIVALFLVRDRTVTALQEITMQMCIKFIIC